MSSKSSLKEVEKRIAKFREWGVKVPPLLVLEWLDFRKAIYLNRIQHIKPYWLENKDLVQEMGYAALLYVDRWEPKISSLSTYFNYKIVGYVRDEMRKLRFHGRTTDDVARKFFRLKELYPKEDYVDLSKRLGVRLDLLDIALNTYYMIMSESELSLEEDIISSCIDDKENTLDIILLKEARDEIISKIQTLSVRESLVIENFYFMETSMEQIAKKLNCSPRRVEQILRTAKNKLKRELSKKGYRNDSTH